jgi:hypothetical protein
VQLWTGLWRLKAVMTKNSGLEARKFSENASPTIDLWGVNVMKQVQGLIRRKTNKPITA